MTPRKAHIIAGFGSRLRRARKIRGMTLEDVGILVGCTKQQISQYECGDYTPSMVNAACLAIALGVSLDYLAGLEGPSPSHKEPAWNVPPSP